MVAIRCSVFSWCFAAEMHYVATELPIDNNSGGSTAGSFGFARLLLLPSSLCATEMASSQAIMPVGGGEFFDYIGRSPLMLRRDLSKVFIGSVAGATLLSQEAQAQTCSPPCYPITAQELSAGQTPTDYSYPTADIRRYGGVGNGSTDCTTALQNAAAVSAAGGGNVIIAAGTYRIASNTTLAANVTLEFLQGGVLSSDNGIQINGSIVAPTGAKIFAGPGTVKFGPARSGVVTVYPEWWGAVGDGIVNCTNAIQKAVNSLQWGGIIQFAGGAYLTAGITALPNSAFIGVGKDQSILKSTAAQPLIYLQNTGGIVNASGFTVRDLTLDGNGIGTIGLRVDNYAAFSVQDCNIYGFSSRGVYFHGSISSTIYRCRIFNCPIGFEGDNASSTLNAVALRDCHLQGCTTYGAKVTAGSLFAISGGSIEACGTSGGSSTGGVLLDNMDPNGLGIAATIEGIWFESNSGYSAIRINPPAVNYSTFAIRTVQIFGGTRNYGIYVDGSANYPNIDISSTTAQNASVYDVLVGTRVVGMLDHVHASSASIVSPDVVRLGHPLTGRYQFPSLSIMANGRLQFESLPGNHANDALAASAGVPVGGVYRNGNALMVRLT
jgi:hypothetical protein